METTEGIKLRKLALKPIQTKIPNGSSSEKCNEDRESHEEEEEERPLSPTGRLFQEPKLNLHVVSIIGCKNRLDPDVVKASLPLSFLKNYRFSSLLVRDKGKMKWVRTKVDLDKHVRVVEVDQLENATCLSGDKFVEDYVHNLTTTYLNDDLSRPLWELHIINVKTSEAEGTAILRVHHSLGDGISLMSVLLSCTRQTSDPKALPTLQTDKSSENINESSYGENKRNRFVTKLLLFLFAVWWFLRLFLNTIIDCSVGVLALCMRQDKGLPIEGPTTQRTSRRIVFKNVSLDDLKLVKKTLNTTINVVVVGATQAGLSMYYNRRYGLENKSDKDDEGHTSDDHEIKDHLAKRLIRLRSVVIVNLRQIVGFRISNKVGNWIGYVLLPLNIKLKDDPLDYVLEAKAILDRKRHSLEALCGFATIGLVYKIFGVKLASALFRRSSSGYAVAFSNVVGPVEEVNFHGHSISYIASSTYGQPVELMVCFQSYMNKMSIVLSGDEYYFPDMRQLCDDIAESIKNIAKSVKEKGEDVPNKEKDNSGPHFITNLKILLSPAWLYISILALLLLTHLCVQLKPYIY